MQVTRALEYANRAVVLLATNYGKDPMLVADIAKATAAPPKFLHQVLQMLARAGVLVSRRGAKRGYELARPPEEISLLDIFVIMEGPLGLTSCTMEGNWCKRESGCTLSGVWHTVQDQIEFHLAQATLDRLAGPAHEKTGCPLRVE